MDGQALRGEPVTFTSGGVQLAGTFTAPEATGPVPAVLLLPGSGQTDRNDNAKGMAINAFPPLVAALEAQGCATLRFDKRGVGRSGGDYWAGGFSDRLADAMAAVEWLRSRPEVDPARVVAVGHSEGALVSVRLAAGAAPVCGAVLLAGSASRGKEVRLWQGRQIADTLTGFNKWIVKTFRIDPAKS